MDHTSKGWNCFNLYMHDGCVAGYICDQSSGQCVLAEPGQGDSQANCEASCSLVPPPEDQYKCNVETFTCEVSTTGNAEDDCSKDCSDETPSELIGQWRGLSVNQGFELGEWDMSFDATSVSYGPVGSPAAVTADVASVGPQTLRLTFTGPADLVGSIYYATYTEPGYPTGPETRGLAIAIQADDNHQTPPQNVVDAMGSSLFDVFVMQGCNPWKDGLCDFSPVFAAAARAELARAMQAGGSPLERRAAGDSCVGFGDCDSCLDGGSTCGWCDGVVTDTDGNVICGDDGNGCCGGDDGFSQCNVAFRKTCPVICDYPYNATTDSTTPTCRAATTPEYLSQQTFNTCEDMPWCTTTQFVYCDESSANPSCKTVYSEEECKATPGCDVSNPDSCDKDACKTVNYIWCDATEGCQGTTNKTQCDQNPDCDPSQATSCDPTTCEAAVYYTCDSTDFTCKMHTGSPSGGTYFNSSVDCEAACVDMDISGVWRALRVDLDFVADEWDFSIGATSIVYTSKATGASFGGTYAIGASDPSAEYPSAAITVTLSTGEVLQGVVSNDRGEDSSLGPITKFMYIALPLSSSSTVESFDAGMAHGKQEFVLMACKDNIVGCDFSSAKP